MIDSLPAGYFFREMSSEEFLPLWRLHSKAVFDDHSPIFRIYDALAPQERENIVQLGKNLGKPFSLRLGLFYGDEFVGWHTGDQKDSHTFYMRNSAILPEHRRRGLYTILISEVLTRVTALGFQVITSRHNCTNNNVIIPKLKAGFFITGMEVSDAFGTLVNLSYFTNPLRRRVMEYRSGDLLPDDEIKKHLGL